MYSSSDEDAKPLLLLLKQSRSPAMVPTASAPGRPQTDQIGTAQKQAPSKQLVLPTPMSEQGSGQGPLPPAQLHDGEETSKAAGTPQEADRAADDCQAEILAVPEIAPSTVAEELLQSPSADAELALGLTPLGETAPISAHDKSTAAAIPHVTGPAAEGRHSDSLAGFGGRAAAGTDALQEAPGENRSFIILAAVLPAHSSAVHEAGAANLQPNALQQDHRAAKAQLACRGEREAKRLSRFPSDRCVATSTLADSKVSSLVCLKHIMAACMRFSLCFPVQAQGYTPTKSRQLSASRR